MSAFAYRQATATNSRKAPPHLTNCAKPLSILNLRHGARLLQRGSKSPALIKLSSRPKNPHPCRKQLPQKHKFFQVPRCVQQWPRDHQAACRATINASVRPTPYRPRRPPRQTRRNPHPARRIPPHPATELHAFPPLHYRFTRIKPPITITASPCPPRAPPNKKHHAAKRKELPGDTSIKATFAPMFLTALAPLWHLFPSQIVSRRKSPARNSAPQIRSL